MRKPERLLLLGSLIFSLAMGEFATRKLLGPPIHAPSFTPPPPGRPDNVRAMRSLHMADPLLGWKLNSGVNYRHRMVSSEGKALYDVVYEVTKDGQRRTSPNHATAAPAIIATGCSFTFGHAVADQDTWPWQLQERLPGYNVMNVADMGYGTDQALLAAEQEVKRFPGHTSAVILGLGGFQIERNRSPQGWLVFTYPFSKPLFRLTSSGGAEYKGQVRFWEPPLPTRLSLFGHLINTAADLDYGIVSHSRARQLTIGILREFSHRFQSRGVHFAVVLLPYVGDDWDDGDGKYLAAGLENAGIPTLNFNLPRLPDGGFDINRFMVTPADKHPNREYNSRLVNQLYPFLESKGIVAAHPCRESEYCPQ